MIALAVVLVLAAVLVPLDAYRMRREVAARAEFERHRRERLADAELRDLLDRGDAA